MLSFLVWVSLALLMALLIYRIVSAVTISENEMKRQDETRSMIIAELLDTERSFMHQLELLLREYVMPIREAIVLPNHSFRRIFGGVGTVHGVTGQFLGELEKLVERHGQVMGKHKGKDESENGDTKQHPLRGMVVVEELSDLFVRFGPSWKLFVEFITHYREGSKMLGEEMSRNERLSHLIGDIKVKLKRRGENLNDVNSLLITPIQRVPRYKMLLETLLKNTYVFPVRKKLQRAVNIIEGIAQYCNTKELEKALQTRLIEINKTLPTGGLVLPGRMLVRETDGMEHGFRMAKVDAQGKSMGKDRPCISLLLLNDALGIIVPSPVLIGTRSIKLYQLPLKDITKVTLLNEADMEMNLSSPSSSLRRMNSSMRRLKGNMQREGFVVKGIRQGVDEEPRSYVIFTANATLSKEWVESIHTQKEVCLSSSLL